MSINLNDGKCHTLEEINNYDKKLIADQFSEGNKTLKELLLKLWNLEIETFACCKGTYEKDHKENIDPVFKTPYLAISITPETKEKVLNFVEYLLAEGSLSKPHIVFKNILTKQGNNNMIVLERTFLNNSSCDKMFESILSACDKMILNRKTNYNKNFQPAIDLIDELSSREIDNPYISEINVRINQNSKTQFSIKNRSNKKLKTSINTKSIDKINKLVDEYTSKISTDTNEETI